MFNNLDNHLDSYIYFYKFFVLNHSFNQYLAGFLSYRDYYDVYNSYYINLIISHNSLLKS